jgi:hypothetical protein
MSLDATKRLLSQKYLGKDGIHGIGLSKARNAVRVHLSPDAASDESRKALLEQMKHDAAPYDILVTEEEGPTKTD